MNRKAASGINISLSAIIQLALVVIVIIALWGLLIKLGNVFVSDEEEATKRNFDRLIASINNMEIGDPQPFPLYLDDDYAIVGYSATEDFIGGTCTYGDVLNYEKIQFDYQNIKPWQCGTGACLCLCEQTSDPQDLCQENDEIIKCVTDEDFNTPLSFEGGEYAGGTLSCPYALVLGTGESLSVYIKRSSVKDQDYDNVHICLQECD